MHIKYLKHWLIGKCQIPLVFLVEMVLSCPITHWRAIFPNSSCVPQLVPTPRAPSAHIWLCTEKRESRAVSPPTTLACFSWASILEPELDLAVTLFGFLSWCGASSYFTHVVALKEELAAEKGKEESHETVFHAPACQWPQTLYSLPWPWILGHHHSPWLALQGWEK